MKQKTLTALKADLQAKLDQITLDLKAAELEWGTLTSRGEAIQERVDRAKAHWYDLKRLKWELDDMLDDINEDLEGLENEA